MTEFFNFFIRVCYYNYSRIHLFMIVSHYVHLIYSTVYHVQTALSGRGDPLSPPGCYFQQRSTAVRSLSAQSVECARPVLCCGQWSSPSSFASVFVHLLRWLVLDSCRCLLLWVGGYSVVYVGGLLLLVGVCWSDVSLMFVFSA